MANNLSRKEIENIYNSTPAPSNGMSRDEIANIYNSYTPEIPKLEQNTTPTPTTDYRTEIERMNKLKADTTAPRTEGENQAIDTYLNSLVDAQRYMDSNKPTTTTSSKVKKQPIGTVEIKADGTRRFTKAMSANEKKNFENQIRRQNQLEQAKVVGKQAKENAQPRERALSANEQRDLERAQSAIEQAKRNDNPYKKLTNTAKKFTELPKKDKPRYDDRGFEINPSITENQSTVDEYLDPNKKLSQADEKKAKQLIREYEESDLGQKNENATTLVFDNAHPDGMAVPSYAVDENGVYHPYLELTPEERQYQQSIGALKTKVKDSESFLVGAMQTVPFVDALQRAGDENGEYARMVANSQKQNPLSYWGGLLGTGVAMNAAGQFALNGTKYGDLINRIAGVDKAGISNRSKAIRRTLAEAAMDVPVDLATDIIPTLTSDLAQDKSAGEVIGNTAFNIGLNGLLNLAPAAISNWSDIRPNGIPEVWTPNKQATQSAVDNVIPVADDVVPQEAKVVEEVKKAIDDIPEVVENPIFEDGSFKGVPEVAQNEKQIVSLNPDLNRAEDAALFKTVENNSNIDVKSVKAANKQLDNNINSLANMFGKQKNNEGVVALKEALNEYAETGSDEALARARQIASEMDQYYSGATYKSRKGNITDFGNGTQGTFTSQVEDFAEKLGAGAVIKNEPLHVTDLDKRINDLFSKYDLTAEDAESVRAWKQAINDYMANPTEEGWNNLLATTSDVSRRSNNLTEFVSSYKGKTKTNPFDQSELISIMDEIDTRRPLSSGVPDVEAPVNANNIPPTNNVPPTPNNPVPPIPEGNGELVERGMSRHVRNDGTPMRVDVPDEIKVDFEENPEMFKRMTNAETKARADAIFERGGDVETTFRRMLSQKDPASLALGHRIAKELSANGQFEKAAQIYRDMGKELTKAGQFSQASVLAMMKNDPLTALHYAQKEIDNLNVNGAKRFGDKWKDFELTPEEVKAFGRIEPGDEKAIAEIYDQIGARLGKEYPTTVMEKLLEARRVSMLFNLRTNIRNFGANVPTLGMRWVSDRVDSLGQHFVHLLDPEFEVTNSIKGAGFRGRKLANEVYNSDTVQAMLKNTNGKYSPDITNSLMQNKQMFKGTPVSRWINKVTNGGIEKVNKKLFGKEGVESGLETVRNATYKALELGDSPFVKENFVERLGSYINARGIKNINDIPDDAIQVAWEEAMKATYKDNSWAVQMLRGIKNGMESIPGVGRPISQAVIPFLQAPGNIAARMVDYSPIKATKGIVDMISGANSGNLNAVRKGIEEFSKGATGTGMIVLGMKLKESGLITGDYSEDKDQRNFEKQHGFKPYALHIGDKYFTYDWAQPFAEPMIIGTLLQEAIDNSDQYDSEILKYFGHEGTTAGKIIGGLKEGASASVNSWFNASPLQGLADLMKSDYSGDSSIAENIYDKTVVDFASSFIPSLVNSAAKTADPIMRNTYDPSNAFGTFLNEQAAKLPGLSDNLPAKYDTWGNEMKYADSKGESFARKFVVPGDYGKDSDDPVDQEINALFDATSDNRVFPLTAPNSVDGVKLNNREVSEYQEDMGTRSREIVESFMDSDYYNDLADNEKAETLNTIYSVSKAITERDLFDKPVADNSTYKKAIAAYDEDGAEGLLNYLEGKAVAKEAGVSATSKAGAAIQDLFNSGDKEGAQRLSEEVNRLSDEGLNTQQQGVYASRGSIHYDADEYADLYSEINTDGKPSITQKEALKYINDNFNGTPEDQAKALQLYESMVTTYTPGENKFAKYDPAQKKYVAADPKDTKNQFKTTLIPKVEPIEEPARKNQDAEWDNATLSSDPYTAIAQSGVGHGNQYIDQAWDKAVLANSSLTPQEFIDTWAAIDSSGNGKHTKDEFKAYLNDNSIDQEEGNMILDMYYPSNWKRPTYKKGKWS